MNIHDRSNLSFLLTVDSATLSNWYSQSSPDDIAYATELLAAYSRELDQLQAQIQIDQLDLELADADQFPEAAAVLSKFRL